MFLFVLRYLISDLGLIGLGRPISEPNHRVPHFAKPWYKVSALDVGSALLEKERIRLTLMTMRHSAKQ